MMNRCVAAVTTVAPRLPEALAPTAAEVMGVREIHVIDPLNRTGKIVVPLSKTLSTKGLSEAMHAECCTSNADQCRDLSLCLLFQKGRCNAGARCRQIHVEPSFIESLRSAALSVKNCCAHHGDVHSTHLMNDSRVVAVAPAQGCGAVVEYPMAAFAATKGLEAAAVRICGCVIKVGANSICRLHTQGRCKFGRDCRNIHLCSNGAAELAQREDAASSVHRSSNCSTPRSERSASTTTFVTPVHEIGFARRAISVAPPTPADFSEVDVASAQSSAVFSAPVTPSAPVIEVPLPTLFVTPASAPQPLADAADVCLDLFSKPLTKSQYGVAPPSNSFVWGFEELVASVCADILREEF